MSEQTIGLIAAIIFKTTAPSEKRVIWGHIDDPNTPTVVTLKYYNYDTAQWESLTTGYSENNTYSSQVFIEGNSYNQALATLDFMLNELFKDTKAGLLTGQALVLLNTDKFPGKLPSGLAAAWYPTGVSAGDTVDIIYDNQYLLRSPDLATRFHSGIYSNQGTWGSLKLLLDEAEHTVRDLSVDGAGNTAFSDANILGELRATAIDVYQKIWAKANAEIDIQHLSEGGLKFELEHTLAGKSNAISLYYDDVNEVPAFVSGPTVTENVKVSKYLSGIEHYGAGSTFNLSFEASGCFNKAYHPSSVAKAFLQGMADLSINPATVPAVADNFIKNNLALTLDAANEDSSNANGQLSLSLYKPNGIITTDQANLTKRINTYGNVATNTLEQFFDESRRLDKDGANTSFDSSIALINGEAQVRNGVLVYGDVDYPAKTGTQVYERRFVKASASSFEVQFGGIVYTDIDPATTGDLNIYLVLEEYEGGADKWFDMGRAFGDDNGDGSGSSRANSIGCRTTGNGGSVDVSFGTNNTANATPADNARIVIDFLTNVNSITQIEII